MESNTWKWGAAVRETYITGYFESELQRKAGRVAEAVRTGSASSLLPLHTSPEREVSLIYRLPLGLTGRGLVHTPWESVRK